MVVAVFVERMIGRYEGIKTVNIPRNVGQMSWKQQNDDAPADFLFLILKEKKNYSALYYHGIEKWWGAMGVLWPDLFGSYAGAI